MGRFTSFPSLERAVSPRGVEELRERQAGTLVEISQASQRNGLRHEIGLRVLVPMPIEKCMRLLTGAALGILVEMQRHLLPF
jgi:hypothetical protein